MAHLAEVVAVLRRAISHGASDSGQQVRVPEPRVYTGTRDTQVLKGALGHGAIPVDAAFERGG